MPRKPLPEPSGTRSEFKLRAVSFSRDSAGKEQRLKEWRERNGLSHHDREHKRNRWTAARHGLQITDEISSVESAAVLGTRGEQIIRTATQAGASAVIIPSLRRLGVGTTQTLLRERIEQAGLAIYSERETENIVLRSEPSPTRDLLLSHIAATDAYEWQVNKERLRRAHINYHDTPEWQAVLQFIAEREHLDGEKLARILEARGFKTLTGKSNWARMQVLLARRELQARKGTAPLQHRNGSVDLRLFEPA